ncbi:putative vomeronasal receptor-like protein 4 [Aotus nancymaae]|uniref:putative vomeronasal receptor-like protein 4 n=1 Tax=Aotus nancymaae TaxID=37293 RepID=UPI000626ACB7|nr:putative vomeronasal receptor-like protein 4 [Aotus nancymaae]
MNTLSTYLVLKNAFFFQAAIGLSANILCLFFHIFSFLQHHKPKPHDLISCHLAFIHVLMFLTAVDVLPPNLLESLPFENDFKCKSLFYINRVMRGLSICTTCLLSVHQASTISPRNFRLARFKHKFTNNIVSVICLFWSLNLSLSSNIMLFTVASSNMSQTNLLQMTKYCSLSPMNSIIRGVFFTLTISRDFLLVGITLLSGMYMVILLFRHQRRSQHLHSTSLSPRSSPEKKATQTILLLVSFFVVMYSVDIIISSSSTLLWMYNPVILNVQILVVNAYATIAPFVQINSDKRIGDTLENMQSVCCQLLTS